MTDDEKRELIAEAGRVNDDLKMNALGVRLDIIDRLADALEGTLTEPEWEYGIAGHGYVTTDRYELDVAPSDLRRRRKAGPWEVVTDDRD